MMMSRIFRYIPLLACGCLVLAVTACRKSPPTLVHAEQLPPIRVSVSVDHPEIHVGDLISYSITVDADTNVSFRLPQFAENLGGFAVRDWKRPDPVITPSGRRGQTHTYVLETYLTGQYELPPASVHYIFNGQTNTIESTPICVEVVTIAEEGDLFSGIRDIKEPVDIIEQQPGRLKHIIIAASAAALAILAVIGLVYFIRRKNNAPVPPVPAHEIAYESLRRLHARNLVEQGFLKLYFFELSTILRHYIENRFGLRAPERTTEEFLQDIQSTNPFSSSQRSILSAFLKECDLVKFANFSVAASDARRVHDVVVSFIEETRERENVVNAEGAR